jgi:hypothetical protein
VSVLVLALAAVLALGGVGSAAASGITKSTVKKLAGKVVDKKARSLSVAHATTADSAATAGSATTATTAGNSSQLDGKAPATYLDRSAHAFLTSSTAVSGSGDPIQIMNPLGITVPAGVGYLHVTGTAAFTGGAANVRVWPSLDSVCVAAGSGYSHSSVGNTTVQVSVPVDFLVAVDAGNHNVRLCVVSGGDTFTSLRSLTITTVAGDFNG